MGSSCIVIHNSNTILLSVGFAAWVPPKEFRVVDDHNKYKCPFSDCNKGFRKLSLVEYHVKYYHSEDGEKINTTPLPRKRKKTVSICKECMLHYSSQLSGTVTYYQVYVLCYSGSTDSEISVGGSTGKGASHPSKVPKIEMDASSSRDGGTPSTSSMDSAPVKAGTESECEYAFRESIQDPCIFK